MAKTFAQLQARAEQAHAHGGAGDAEALGGLLGRELDDVAQQADAADAGMELLDGVGQMVAHFHARVALLWVVARSRQRAEDGILLARGCGIVEGNEAASAAAAQRVDGFVGGDARHPGGEG